VTAHPQVYCALMVDTDDCHCMTEQGTRYLMPKDVCKSIAIDGPAYDPFKPEKRERDRQDDRSKDRGTVVSEAPAGAVAAILPRVYTSQPRASLGHIRSPGIPLWERWGSNHAGAGVQPLRV
jgi:hypothetical protein